MSIRPVEINITFNPLLPQHDTQRVKPFTDADYRVTFDDEFEVVVQELTDLSVRLLKLLPDPSLSPDERLERLARVVPNSQMITAHRRSARHKLYQLRRRLDELVPEPGLSYQDKLEWLVQRLEGLVPDEGLRPIERLERIGDYRSTDVGVSPRQWQ